MLDYKAKIRFSFIERYFYTDNCDNVSVWSLFLLVILYFLDGEILWEEVRPTHLSSRFEAGASRASDVFY